ncbi:MAG: proton-conducting transporter membrane subunit [Proteobacteria bacterium]|nr:proton-conducting transporter membrane subunit [Pseudomonadota bacterium]
MMVGHTIMALAHSLDLLMTGWEFVGICSFLLICFYGHRNTTVNNAFKVLAVYRISDAGLLLGAWLGHILWHNSQSFMFLRDADFKMHLHDGNQIGILIMTGFILLAAAGKSAQFPFTFWLSRAMEGPTPSSAVFYGAMSVHAGVFLLLRTYTIWTAAPGGPIIVGLIGITTTLIATGIARTQSNIKGQIAFSSAAQVGIIFVEVALGFKNFAMFHMAANASLRCYQLMTASSSVSNLLKYQSHSSFSAQISSRSIESFLPRRMINTLYIFCINEGFLEQTMKMIAWNPMRKIGQFLGALNFKGFGGTFFILLSAISATALSSFNIKISVAMFTFLIVAVSLASLFEITSFIRAWNSIMLANVLIAIQIMIFENHEIWQDLLLFLHGIVLFWIIGLVSIYKLTNSSTVLKALDSFHGRAERNPVYANILLICSLGIAGFPISGSYIGQDAVLHHAIGDYLWLALVLAFVFAINGLSAIRVYCKLCLGRRTP